MSKLRTNPRPRQRGDLRPMLRQQNRRKETMEGSKCYPGKATMHPSAETKMVLCLECKQKAFSVANWLSRPLAVLKTAGLTSCYHRVRPGYTIHLTLLFQMAFKCFKCRSVAKRGWLVRSSINVHACHMRKQSK